MDKLPNIQVEEVLQFNGQKQNLLNALLSFTYRAMKEWNCVTLILRKFQQKLRFKKKSKSFVGATYL